MQRCERCKSLASKSGANVRGDARAAKSSENAWRNRRRPRTPRRTTGARWTRRPRCGRELARTEWGARRASRAGALTKDLSGHNGVPRRVWGVAASLSSREKAQISYRLISLFQRVSARAGTRAIAARDFEGRRDRTAASRGESVAPQSSAALAGDRSAGTALEPYIR